MNHQQADLDTLLNDPVFAARFAQLERDLCGPRKPSAANKPNNKTCAKCLRINRIPHIAPVGAQPRCGACKAPLL